MDSTDEIPLIHVEGLKKHIPITTGILFDHIIGSVRALDGVDLILNRRNVVGLVGESGSGKTTLAKIILLLEKPTDGRTLYEGRDILGFQGRDLKDYRRNVQAVFQDPFAVFNRINVACSNLRRDLCPDERRGGFKSHDQEKSHLVIHYH